MVTSIFAQVKTSWFDLAVNVIIVIDISVRIDTNLEPVHLWAGCQPQSVGLETIKLMFFLTGD